MQGGDVKIRFFYDEVNSFEIDRASNVNHLAASPPVLRTSHPI